MEVSMDARKTFKISLSPNKEISLIESESCKPLLYKILYALLINEISSAVNPRLLSPSRFIVLGSAGLPATVTKAGTS